jgi:hypothetical protein
MAGVVGLYPYGLRVLLTSSESHQRQSVCNDARSIRLANHFQASLSTLLSVSEDQLYGDQKLEGTLYSPTLTGSSILVVYPSTAAPADNHQPHPNHCPRPPALEMDYGLDRSHCHCDQY